MLKALGQQSNAVDEAAHSPDQQAVRPYTDRLTALTDDRGASE